MLAKHSGSDQRTDLLTGSIQTFSDSCALYPVNSSTDCYGEGIGGVFFHIGGTTYEADEFGCVELVGGPGAITPLVISASADPEDALREIKAFYPIPDRVNRLRISHVQEPELSFTMQSEGADSGNMGKLGGFTFELFGHEITLFDLPMELDLDIEKLIKCNVTYNPDTQHYEVVFGTAKGELNEASLPNFEATRKALAKGIFPDGTADLMFDVCASGDNVAVVWQDLNTTFGDGQDIDTETAAAAVELNRMLLDCSGEIPVPGEITPLSTGEDVYETMPRTFCSGSAVRTAWISSTVNDPLYAGPEEYTFGPNDQCMRAHVVTFLWRAVGCPEPTRTDNPFVDVPENAFYYKPVL